MTFNYAGHNTKARSPRAKKHELLYLVTHGYLAVPVLSHIACGSSVGQVVYENCVTHLLLDPLTPNLFPGPWLLACRYGTA